MASDPAGSLVPSHIFSDRSQRRPQRNWVNLFLVCFCSASILAGLCYLQIELDRHHDQRASRVERLRLLPRGELLRPALLGFHHLGADLLWLRIVQVFGEQVVTEWDYEWLYHAFDVVTTLDPQYTYVYDVGGTVLAEFAHRVELSNQLLEKGFKANPTAWRLPFVLGFNHFFHLQDYVSAGRYMSEAARIPGRPYYVDTLAARLYVEGGSPALALQYLEAMIQQATSPDLRRIYVEKYNEVLIARDLRALDEAVERYRKAWGVNPQTLSDLVSKGFLSAIPDEPFGGEYRVDPQTGAVSSSTHPERLRLYRPGEAGKFRKSI
jgi:hypothetical protein